MSDAGDILSPKSRGSRGTYEDLERWLRLEMARADTAEAENAKIRKAVARIEGGRPFRYDEYGAGARVLSASGGLIADFESHLDAEAFMDAIEAASEEMPNVGKPLQEGSIKGGMKGPSSTPRPGEPPIGQSAKGEGPCGGEVMGNSRDGTADRVLVIELNTGSKPWWPVFVNRCDETVQEKLAELKKKAELKPYIKYRVREWCPITLEEADALKAKLWDLEQKLSGLQVSYELLRQEAIKARM